VYSGSWIEIAGRLLVIAFFLIAGVSNLTPARIRDHIDRMAEFGVPLPAAAFWTGITLQFAGCAMLLADWHPAIGAGCLIVFTVVANAIFHRYWLAQDPGRRNIIRILLLDGVAILGGLLLLLASVK
jgi:uncharacterized membrane protein YphA (DoxX/SURF4 family)